MSTRGAGANPPMDRKEAERRRLAEALRANLARRKAQGRDRRRGPAQGVAETAEDAAQEIETGD